MAILHRGFHVPRLFFSFFFVSISLRIAETGNNFTLPVKEMEMLREDDAKRLVVDRLLKDVSEEYPFAIAEGIYAETPDAFIVEGIIGSCHEDFREGTGYYAVHKEDGRCGLVCPPPGQVMDRESLERNFVWDWVVDKVVKPAQAEESAQAEE